MFAFLAHFRRRRGGSGSAAASPERERSPQPPIEFERAASRELVAVDRLVRKLYAALSSSDAGEALASLLATGGRFDLAGCRWTPPGEVDLGAEALVALARSRSLRWVERSRTVHIVADVAVVVGSCDVISGADTWTAVLCMQLRRENADWRLRELVCREETFPISEKTADPRPLAARGRTGR